MAAPSVSVIVRDGGLGIVPPGAGGQFIKIGPSPIGVVNSVYSVADQTTLIKTIGNGGSLTEAGALALAVGGQGSAKPSGLLLVPVNPSSYGTASAVTHVGPGTGTVVVTVKPSNAFQIKCIIGGAAGVATWQTSLDGGITYGSTWLSAATIITPGVSFTTLAFGAGTAITGDVVTVGTTGTTALASGSGTLIATLSSACPVDAYTVIATITTAGALGAAFFTYSLDGVTVSSPNIVPASGNFAIPDGNDPLKAGQCSTGIFLTFSGTFVVADTYSFTTTTASYTTTDLTNAFNTNLQGDSRFSSGAGLHIVGPATTSVNAAALAVSLDVLMGNAAGAYKFNRAMIENPTDTDSSIISAYAATSTPRTGCAPGFHTITSPVNGRQQSRPATWSVMARLGSVPASEDAGRVASGSLPGVLKLARDESVTPGLDNARLSSLTTISGRNGFWVANARLLANPGSDFSFWQYGRVVDLGSYFGRLALLNFLNDSVRVNADGTISDKDARAIEQYVDASVRNGLISVNCAFSDLFFNVSRTTNVLSSQTITSTLRILPVAYAKNISLDIGFTNQALVVKAA